MKDNDNTMALLIVLIAGLATIAIAVEKLDAPTASSEISVGFTNIITVLAALVAIFLPLAIGMIQLSRYGQYIDLANWKILGLNLAILVIFIFVFMCSLTAGAYTSPDLMRLSEVLAVFVVFLLGAYMIVIVGMNRPTSIITHLSKTIKNNIEKKRQLGLGEDFSNSALEKLQNLAIYAVKSNDYLTFRASIKELVDLVVFAYNGEPKMDSKSGIQLARLHANYMYISKKLSEIGELVVGDRIALEIFCEEIAKLESLRPPLNKKIVTPLNLMESLMLINTAFRTMAQSDIDYDEKKRLVSNAYIPISYSIKIAVLTTYEDEDLEARNKIEIAKNLLYVPEKLLKVSFDYATQMIIHDPKNSELLQLFPGLRNGMGEAVLRLKISDFRKIVETERLKIKT